MLHKRPGITAARAHGRACGALGGAKVGSSIWRAAMSTLVMLTPISEEPKPTAASLAPLRSTAPRRCAGLKGA